MTDDAGTHGPRMTQLVLQGMQSPALFTLALSANFLLLGAVLMSVQWLRNDTGHLYNEVRILQVHVQDQNAILIREGLKRPNDEHAGPTGH